MSEDATSSSYDSSSETEREVTAATQRLVDLFKEDSPVKLSAKTEIVAQDLYRECLSSEPLELSPMRKAMYERLGLFSPKLSVPKMKRIIASTLELQGDKLVVKNK